MEEQEAEPFVVEAVLEAMDLVEQFFLRFLTGELGQDRDKAKAQFLYERRLNSNPDTLDEDE